MIFTWFPCLCRKNVSCSATNYLEELATNVKSNEGNGVRNSAQDVDIFLGPNGANNLLSIHSKKKP
jgi:hypothetical protein